MEEEIELPDGRTIVVGPNDDREAVRAQILQEFPDLGQAAPTQQTVVEDEFGGNGFISRLRRGSSRFGKGVERIASGDVTPREAAEAVETSVRSTAAPLGGDFIAAGSENITRFLTGQENNPDAVRDHRARRQELTSRGAGAQVQGTASELLGFGGIQALVTKIPGLAVLGRGTTIKAKAANTGRTAVAGAVDAGVGTAAQTGDVGEGADAALVGAVVAPAAGGVLGFAADRAREVPRFVKSLIGKPNEAALNGLAKRVGVDADTLEASIAEFSRLNGRPPSLAEISDGPSIERMRELAQSRASAGAAFEQAEELFAAARPGQLQKAIEQGRTSQSAKALEQTRDKQLTAVLRNDNGQGAVADIPLPKDTFREILEDPEVLQALPRLTRNRVISALDEGELTVDIAEQARNALRQNNDFALREAGTEIGDTISDSVPAYRAGFERYKLQSQFIDGLEEGRNVRTARTSDFEQIDRTPAQQQGLDRGARAGLAEAAGESGSSAVRTAGDLTEEGTRRRVAAASGPAEAERLSDLGRTNVRSAQNLRRLSPNSELPPSLAEGAEDVGELTAVALGRAGPFALGRAVRKTVQNLENLGVPPQAARNMAEMFTDPQQSSEVVNRLREIGVDEQSIARIVQDITTIITAERTADQ